MSEVENADALARWLDSVPGAPVPESIDQDVVETIYALKPDMAPPHTLSIHEVLESILEGPLVDPAVANALRNWLNAGPGTPPPRLLPIGVVEATYALRPEMAPSPSLNIDDVLDGIMEGPFAATSSSSDAATEPVKLHTMASPAPPPSFRFRGPALGAIAMAAVALLVIYPESENVLTAPSPFDGSNAIADAPTLQSVSFDAAEPEEMNLPKPASEKPKAEKTRNPLPKAARRSQSPKQKPSPALSAAPPELPPLKKQSYTPPPTPGAESIPMEDMGAADEMESAEPFAIPPPPPAASVEALPTRRRAPRKNRGRNRADMEMAEDVAEAAEPGSTRASIDYWYPKIQALKSDGNTSEALAQLDAILPSFERDLPSRLKLLRLKVEILRELGRNTEAQQVERLIKRIKAVE